MELISHRGNLNGADPERENNIIYIKEAIDLGFSVEIDVWVINETWYLGHDNPDYKIVLDGLSDFRDHLYLHIKTPRNKVDVSCLKPFNYFWHEDEPFVITSKGDKWYYPCASVQTDGVNLMPEFSMGLEKFKEVMSLCPAVCSDYVLQFR